MCRTVLKTLQLLRLVNYVVYVYSYLWLQQNVGQLFSNPAHIDDLPPILRPRRLSRHTITDTSAPLNLASLFGPDEHHRSNGSYATFVN